MGATIRPIPFTSDQIAITVSECSSDCAKLINRTITLKEYSNFLGNVPVNVFEIIGNNGVEIRFESHHGQWIQGD